MSVRLVLQRRRKGKTKGRGSRRGCIECMGVEQNIHGLHRCAHLSTPLLSSFFFSSAPSVLLAEVLLTCCHPPLVWSNSSDRHLKPGAGYAKEGETVDFSSASLIAAFLYINQIFRLALQVNIAQFSLN
mmetsp:Transcript_39048/g.76803  ORF Transcript_39048/g.76803 Transcript_39048/m.76803 type:complete len:129 (-) Transcript_39048:1565-1951(-)